MMTTSLGINNGYSNLLDVGYVCVEGGILVEHVDPQGGGVFDGDNTDNLVPLYQRNKASKRERW